MEGKCGVCGKRWGMVWMVLGREEKCMKGCMMGVDGIKNMMGLVVT